MNRGLHRRPLLFLGFLGMACFWSYPEPALAGAGQANPGRDLAFSEAASGWRLLKTGDAAGAAQAFSRAIELVPGESSYYVGLGTAYVKLLKEDEAERVFLRAVELDPNATRAHALLGDLSARKGDWEQAIRHYRIAIRQDPNDVTLEESLRKAQQHHAAEAGFDRLFATHFIVKFHGGNDRELARNVADRMEVIYQEIGQSFGHFPAKTTTVVVYPDRRLPETGIGPEWAGGLYDGTLRFSGDDLRRSRLEAERSLRHEYTHAVVDELAGGHAPAWLNEGLAQVFDGRQPPGPDRRRTGDPDTMTRLHLLHGSFVGLTRETAEQAYADSYTATKALIARYGMERVRALLVALVDHPDFSRTFELVLHERYRDFEAVWMGTQTGRRF